MPKYEAEPDMNWEGCPVTFTEEDEKAAEAENEGADKEDQAFHAKCPPRGCGKNDGWPVDLTRVSPRTPPCLFVSRDSISTN